VQLDFDGVHGQLFERAFEADAARSELTASAGEVEQYRASLAATGRRREQAQFGVASARQMVSQAEQEHRKAQADLTYWEAEFQREEQLLSSGAISKEEYDSERARYVSAQAAVKQAQARVAQARADLSGSQAGVEAAQADTRAAGSQVRAAQARVAKAGADLRTASTFERYTQVRAPMNGVVLERLISPGVLVGPGMAILRMADLSRVRLQANVGERDLKRLRIGTPVVAHLLFQSKTLRARVTSLFPMQDAVARTAVVEVVTPNPGQALIPGQYLSLDFIAAEKRDALSVPRRAVFTVNGQPMVWVVENDRASQRKVTTGLAGPERIEIVDGLQAGDEVVYAGMEALTEGQPITRVPWGAAEGKAQPPAPKPKEKPTHEMPGMPGMEGMEGMPGMEHGGHGN
jgi:RND family efflux transporter MFP subunit